MEFRMIGKANLAEQIHVYPSTITKYLNGDARPKSDNFVKIYQVLGFPAAFFTKETKQISIDAQSPKLWRSFASAKKAARMRGEVVLDWQVELWNHFNGIFNLPRFDLEHLQIKNPEFEAISYDQIDSLALQVRQHWGIGQTPIRNLVRHMERSGIVVNSVNLMVQKLDAVSTIRESVPYVLLNSFEHASARSRFDAAHELGHILLHSQVGKKGLTEDGFRILEDQAHYFASSLLLPEEAFLRDLWAPTMKCFVELKSKWVASIQAMMRRALSLKAITQAQYGYLNIAVSKKHWRKSEPLDDTLKVEEPRLFAKCLERLSNEKGVRPEEVINDIRLPIDVAAQIFAVDYAYFQGDQGSELSNVVTFKREEEQS